MYNPFKSFWNQNPASICFDATCNPSLDIHARSLIFQQWNYSNDVILKLFNCSSLLFWSFCVSLSWTYIVLNGLNKSRLIIGKQKPGKILINKTSVFFSWIRKWFHSWDRMFWYFHSCSELVKKSKHPFYEWNYTTHWISSIYAWTIKNPTVIFRRALFLGSSISLQNPLHSCYISLKKLLNLQK